MLNDYLATAHALSAAGRPFVIATVVRAEAPTSAKAGAKAIITADGGLDGWVGGSCTQPTVVRESLKALADGAPRFLRMCPPEQMLGQRPGMTEVVLHCISGGTLEIYLEPHLPPPHILAIGHLPVVEALAALGSAMNFRVTVIGENAQAAQFPGAAQVLAYDLGLDAEHLSQLVTLSDQTYVLVASHGNYDEPALEAALRSPAAYVGLVASRKRRDAVLDYLRGSGLGESELARLRCPAGLDLGAVTPDEIALSILAEIVNLRRRPTEQTTEDGGRKTASDKSPSSVLRRSSSGPLSLPDSILAMRPAEIPTPGPGEALDPVCYMLVDIASAKYQTDYQGQTHYFCAPACKRSFDKNPQPFLDALRELG
jgi:xanthine dehydrogenase accessory factor